MAGSFSNEARAFLSKPLIARLSANGADGYPHTVPVWFMLDGDDVVVITDRGTRKVRLFEADPRGAVVIGGDPGDGAGYLLKGDVAVEPDPEFVWLERLTYHYEEAEQAAKDVAEWRQLDMIILRMTVRSIIKVA
jgi:PPOX class probable F420-dependent enzyme